MLSKLKSTSFSFWGLGGNGVGGCWGWESANSTGGQSRSSRPESWGVRRAVQDGNNSQTGPNMFTLSFSTLARLGVALEKPYNWRVVHGALDELLQGQLPIQVLVHLAEDLVCALLWRWLILWHLHHGTHHFVDGLQTHATVSWVKGETSIYNLLKSL